MVALFFFLVQIIALAIQYFLFQLGIELLMLDAFIGNHISYFHTKVSSASRWGDQNLSAIGGSNSRSPFPVSCSLVLHV